MAGPTVDRRTTTGWLLPALVALATAATLVVNYLANSLPINGQTTGDVTRRVEVYFVPAGYVFSIWSLIYAGLLAFSVYVSLSLAKGRADSGAARAIAPWYLLTAVANCCWLFAWHHNAFPLSMAVMVVLLGALIVIYRIQDAHPATSTFEYWTVHIPFRVYLGWISVATIANATITLDDAGWNGFGISEPTWGVIMVLVATALGLVMSLRHSDIAYAAVLIWALVGIAVRLSDTTNVVAAALAGAAALVAAVVLVVVRRNRTPALRTRSERRPG
ncbi:tryptophan-rich sensory protein [Mycobacterium sp. SMC-4]|uniref:tryptophan-rich sensory protein n=1 Tax=Mycobacterium sp. SMC-4 TaxID=2857059 RepID=UPI003D08170B